MRDLLNLIRSMLLGLFRSKTSLEAEILALRHQLNVLRRASPQRPVFSNFDRMILVCLYRIAPRILDALTIVEPETVIRWLGRLSLLLALEIASATSTRDLGACAALLIPIKKC